MRGSVPQFVWSSCVNGFHRRAAAGTRPGPGARRGAWTETGTGIKWTGTWDRGVEDRMTDPAPTRGDVGLQEMGECMFCPASYPDPP